MKIVFFGTDNFALKALSALAKHHEIAAVVTTPDAKVGRKQILQGSPVSVLAEELKLPVLKPVKLKTDIELEAKLKEISPDLFVVVVYGKIIPESILDIPKMGTINVHPSLLPKYRGPAPIRTPLLNGETKTGVSIMLIDKEVDHGPILMSEEVAIEPDDNNISLTEKLAAIAAPLLVKAIEKYGNKTIIPKEQEHDKATFTKIITKDDGKISWQKSANEIYNQFRAFYEWPGIWTTWQGQILKITDCVPIEETSEQNPGTVLPNGFVVCGNKTILQLNRIQLAGKNETDIKSFLNGYKSFAGSKLGD